VSATAPRDALRLATTPIDSPLWVGHDPAAFARRPSLKGGSPERRKVDQQEGAAEDLLAEHYDRVRLTGAARDDNNNEGDPASPDDKE
jgi:hypothetical protein